MTAVPLGRGAYKRLYAGTPEVKLLNRWLEANPANPREGTSILSRPGTTQLLAPFDQGSFTGTGSMRGNYELGGLFDGGLFTVCGSNLYLIAEDLSVTPIQGTVGGTSYPEVAWQKGIGYERFWISDGITLQYYEGLSSANGTLSLTGTIVNGTDKFEIGGVYYVWGTSFSGSDAGTSSNPYVVKPTDTAAVLDPMGQLILAINATGTAGVDYSATITVANAIVSAANNSGAIPATSAKLTALTSGSAGNSITFTITGGTALAATGSGTLTNGGIHILQTCTLPDGVTPGSIAQLKGYVLIAQSDNQKFYWVNPGEITVDPLNFASKESSPDPIISMRAVGDQVMIMGAKSTENWYATGNLDSPFAPIDGRVYARGVVAGTPVVVDDGIILVGDDGRVYSIGFSSGDTTDTAWGVTRISNNGVEERIRYAIRREAGLTP
jgi:hypothetical protein